MWKPLIIGDKVAKTPIIQGGMGVGVTLSNLAAAVANAGGIGIISAVIPGFREKDIASNYREANIRALRQEIRAARSKTNGLIGVNIMVALTNFADMAATAIEEKVDMIISGAGMPMDLPKYRTEDSTTKLIPIVSTARAAKILIKRWMDRYNYMPDAFVVEGPKSGGHQGVKMEDLKAEHAQLDVELKNVVELVKEYAHIKNIPVIAAGGVDDGADMYKFVAMGASGVQVGSRFVATHECDATESFKKEYTKMNGPDDIVVIKSPVGLPLRVINNSFVKSLSDGSKKPKVCPFKCLVTCEYEKVDFCIASALMVAHRGNTDSGVMCCGADGWKIKDIVHVDELIADFAKKYDAAEKMAHA